jgi:hypothetical protein
MSAPAAKNFPSPPVMMIARIDASACAAASAAPSSVIRSSDSAFAFGRFSVMVQTAASFWTMRFW